ncbi:hypothetical protein AB1L30_26695 [Bremerella sp. JC817]|uniref:hypothetical protein n=1 Tax=Bremerella sp. JC817 TaxID=3231756 RepID=UPI0034599D55
MSVFRNLLIVGLLICVAYNGYVIYRNQLASSPTEATAPEETAPLFSAEAFTELAENRSQVTVKEVPTVITPAQPAQTDAVVANPVLESSVEKTEVLPVSAEVPANPRGSRFSETATVATEPVEPAEVAEAPQTDVVMAPLGDITPKVLSFEDAWTQIEMSEAAFTWAIALRQIQQLIQRDDLTNAQREQVLAKGDELAETVIFASNKHLAQPALTYLPGTNVVEIAKTHEIPVSFLRQINGWDEQFQPTPGDSVKVLQGPITLVIDLPAKTMRMTVGDLYAGRMSIGKADVTVPAESILNVEMVEEVERLSIGSVAVVIDQENIAPEPNSLLVTADDWKLLHALTGSHVDIRWIEEKAPVETVVAAPTTPEPEMPVPVEPMTSQPVDALKMEVFAPAVAVLQGKPARYGIEITNMSDKPSDLVQVVVNLSEGIEPIKVEGQPGRIAPGQAMFDPMTIEAGESVRLVVTIETKTPGQFLVRPELQCAQPATRYATEIQLKVAAAESISAEVQKQEAESPLPEKAMAEAPQNPAKEIR